MKTALFLIVAVASLPSSGGAQGVEDFLSCRSIEDSLERLRCYDAIDVPGPSHEAYVRVDELEGGGPPRVVPCPLLLEVAFEREKIERQQGWTTGRSGRVQCEDSRIAVLHIQAQRSTGGVEVAITANIQVQPSYDRLADLEFTLLGAGEEASYRLRLGEVDAEEGKVERETTRLRLSETDYMQLFDEKGTGRVRIVMEVRDNR